MSLVVTVEVTELIATLKKNRDQHAEIFAKAVEQYREQMIEYLNARLDDVKAGKWIKHHINLPIPESHVDDYDRVIRMLERHREATINIPESTYNNYVEDNWQWKNAFILNTASYVGAAPQ